jgi:putative oxidoreductase
MITKLLSYKINEFISPDIAIAFLRIVTSATMLTHGIPKLMRVIEGDWSFRDPIGLGPEVSLFLITFAEFFCAFLVLIGFATRLASVPLIIGMAITYFIVHGDDPFSQSEKSFMFMYLYILIFFTGSGKYSVDRILFKGKR